jgi:hypothetical protein
MSKGIDKQRLREAIARHRPLKPGAPPRHAGGHDDPAGGGRPPSAPQTKHTAQPGRQGGSRERG